MPRRTGQMHGDVRVAGSQPALSGHPGRRAGACHGAGRAHTGDPMGALDWRAERTVPQDSASQPRAGHTTRGQLRCAATADVVRPHQRTRRWRRRTPRAKSAVTTDRAKIASAASTSCGRGSAGQDWVGEGAVTDWRATTPLLPTPGVCASPRGAFGVSPAPGASGFRRAASRLARRCATPARDSYPRGDRVTRPPVGPGAAVIPFRTGGPLLPTGGRALLPGGSDAVTGGRVAWTGPAETLTGGRAAFPDGSPTAVVGSLAVTGAGAVGSGTAAVTGGEVLAVGRGSFAATAAAVAVGTAGAATGWAWAGLANSGTSAVVVAAAAVATASNATRAGWLLVSIGLAPIELSGGCAGDPWLAVAENDAQWSAWSASRLSPPPHARPVRRCAVTTRLSR